MAHRLPLAEFLQRGLVDPEVRAFIWNHQTLQLACAANGPGWRRALALPAEELLALATGHLGMFSHVGFVETFEKDRDLVLQSLGMTLPAERITANASPMRPAFNDLPGSSKALLYELTALDRQLYETAWIKGNAACRRYGDLTATCGTIDSAVASVAGRRECYLDMLQQCLTGSLYEDASFAPFGIREFDPHVRESGLDWPERAETMIGEKRLANLRELVTRVLQDNIPGDLIETGVWRGGACILMRAILLAHGETRRRVWVADSFQGLPSGNASIDHADFESDFHEYPQLAASLEEVQENFRTYGLLDQQVVFLEGWFKDTLPTTPIERLALLRLDCDMYESTMEALHALYPKLSQGGYVIVDDYHVVSACRQAVHDYCSTQGLLPELQEIDGVGVYWKKTEPDFQSLTKAEAGTEVLHTELIDQLDRAMCHLNRTAIRQLLVTVSRRDADLAQHRLRMSVLDRHLADQNTAVQELSRQLAMSMQTISAIHASSSWKLTAPLRAVRAFFDKPSGRK